MLRTLSEVVSLTDFPTNADKKDSNWSIKIRKKGNELFMKRENKQDTNAEILSLYTKSAAYAENDSEELAFAYGNRSALLLDFCKYKESIVDIERALKITKSKKLIDKLLARKLECLSLKDKKVDLVSAYEVPKPTMKPSKTIPCASEFVSLKFDKKYGRHVVANQNIKPGTIISIEKFFGFPKLHKLYLNCSHCLNMAYNGIPCDSCPFTIYCSENCKKEAWKCYHDIECPLLGKLFHLNIQSFAMMNAFISILRILIQSVKKEGIDSIIRQANYIDNNKDLGLDIFFDNELFQSEKFKTFYSLSSGTLPDDLNHKSQFFINMIIPSLCETEIFNKSNNDLGKMSIFLILTKLFKKFVLNTFEFQHLTNDYKSDDRTNFDINKYIGNILAPFCSFLNHSCEPNVGRSFSNGQVILFSTNYIKKGQQLFISYGPTLFHSVSDRRINLKRYNFECSCNGCKENFMITDTDDEETDKQIQELCKEISKLGLMETFKAVVQYKPKYPVTIKHLNDVKKILEGFKKYCNNLNIIEYLHPFEDFIIKYIYYFYGMKFDIPGKESENYY